MANDVKTSDERGGAHQRVEALEADMAILKEWMPQLFTRKPAKIPVRTWKDDEPQPGRKTA